MNLPRRTWARLRDRLRGRSAVVDACRLFNELDLLELRLRELWDAVDAFVVVEAAYSHAGASKPLFFAESAERFAPYREKVAYHVLRTPPISAPRTQAERTVLENHQRDAIGEALARLGLHGRDVVVVSDLDELPRATAVPSLHGRLAASPSSSSATTTAT